MHELQAPSLNYIDPLSVADVELLFALSRLKRPCYLMELVDRPSRDRVCVMWSICGVAGMGKSGENHIDKSQKILPVK